MAKKIKINKDELQDAVTKVEKKKSKKLKFRFIPNRKKIFQISGLIILFFAVVSGLYLFDNKDSISFLKTYARVDDSYSLLLSEALPTDLVSFPPPAQVRDKENPINGILLTSDEYEELLKKHPIAMTVNNHESARPQHGLTQADTVLEVLAEGGITRYVPIFYQNQDVAKIGPIRSLRYYMIEFASGYNDAIILHHGWAGFDNAPWENYTERTDARGAVWRWGIKNVQTAGSTYRDLEKANRSGYVHSLYTGFDLVNPEVERLASAGNWELGGDGIEPLTFKFDDKLEDRGDFNEVEITFLSLASNAYKSSFKYDKATNTYLRSIAGKADIDALNNQQIAPKNVVIEWHNYQDAQDGHSRLIIDMIAEDKVTILRDGKVIEGTWKKDCRLCRTKYFDAEGNEIPLNRGQIWIVVAVKVGDREVSNVNFIE